MKDFQDYITRLITAENEKDPRPKVPASMRRFRSTTLRYVPVSELVDKGISKESLMNLGVVSASEMIPTNQGHA